MRLVGEELYVIRDALGFMIGQGQGNDLAEKLYAEIKDEIDRVTHFYDRRTPEEIELNRKYHQWTIDQIKESD